MRTLFFGTPAFGHIVPQLALARALRQQSHEVAFVSAASMAGLLGPENIELIPAGPEIPEMVGEVARATGINLFETTATPETEAELFATARIDLGYLDCLAAARAWKPDLIVAEVYDLIAPMVGAELEVPVTELALGPAVLPENADAMRTRARTRHAKFGLEVGPALRHLDTCPPSLQIEGWHAPDTRLALRPEAYTGGVSPTAPAAEGSRPRPRILVNFGTITVIPELIASVARELLKQDLDLRITLGPARTAAEFDLESDRVEYVGFTPLAHLLTDVDLVVSAGGAGTVLGALAFGLPLVVTPLGADQPVHAARAEAVGAGVAFKIGDAEPRAVAAAVAKVLAEPGFRQAAQRVAAEIAAMPSPEVVAETLAADLG